MANRKRKREYYNLKMNNEVRNTAKKLRRKFLRYKDAGDRLQHVPQDAS